MGGGVTGNAISCQVTVKWGPIGKLQEAALAAGVDPENIDLTVTKQTLAAKSQIRFLSVSLIKSCIVWGFAQLPLFFIL